jgi:acetolactate synthase I/II/III large subunit
MTRKWAGEIAVDALLSEGVEVMFGMVGGHIAPIMDYAYRKGINVHQVRHEQAAAYAADAYARVSKKPGVCFATAGPGMTNMFTAVHMAHLARSPLVCLLGAHKTSESHRGAMQEGWAQEVYRSVTKWTIRCEDPNLISFYIRKAFRDSMAYPPGPVAIEMPIDLFNWDPIVEEEQVAYLPGNWRSGRMPKIAGDEELVEKAVDAILQAKRPLLIGGDGLHWSDAGEALRTFVETSGIPFNLRRMGRGAVPENHDLAVNGSMRKKLFQESDLIIVLGLQLGYFENFGQWKTNAKFIQINANQMDILPALPTKYEIIGDSSEVLKQMQRMIERKGLSQNKLEGLRRLNELKQNYEINRSSDIESLWNDKPIHPKVLGKEVADFLADDTTIILDSFTGSAFLTDQLIATRSGQIIDSGLSGGIGHGIGMGIGAQNARPGKPVFVMMGDGGIGVGGGDIETASRYGLPIVYMIYNDSTLMAGSDDYCYGKDFKVLGPNARGGFDFIPDIRYDKMFATVGCHVEHVTEASEIKPALQRSFESGKTAVINVIGTKHVTHPLYDSYHLKEMFWHLPANEVEEPARRRHHEGYYPKFHNGKTLDIKN